MIFRGKLRQDMTNAMLSGLFNIDEKQVEEAFEIGCLFDYHLGLEIPKQWTRADLCDAMRNAAYRKMNENLDPYYDTLRQAFEVRPYSFLA